MNHGSIVSKWWKSVNQNIFIVHGENDSRYLNSHTFGSHYAGLHNVDSRKHLMII